jgi:biotin carboxyl carrier protein
MNPGSKRGPAPSRTTPPLDVGTATPTGTRNAACRSPGAWRRGAERPAQSAMPPASEAAAVHGETLAILERVVVAPTDGRFRPLTTADGSLGLGATIRCGQTIGHVDSLRASTPVCSPFQGRLMGMLAAAGEHVWRGKPVAWLRLR